MDRNYKLNVVGKINSTYCLPYGFYICEDAHDYIVNSVSFKQAYENCTDADWLDLLIITLYLDINDDDLLLMNFMDTKESKYRIRTAKRPSTNLRNRWKKQYVKYVKDNISWRKLRRALLEYECIKKIKKEGE